MKTLIVLIGLLMPSLTFAQYNKRYSELTMQADSLFMEGDYEAASRAFGEAVAMTDFVQGVHLYNGACAAALAGDTETAFNRLYARLNLERNWYSDNIEHDDDLASLKNDGRWVVLLDSLNTRKRRIEANFDKPLRRRLQMIMKTDQEVRIAFMAARNQMPYDSIAVAEAEKEMQRVDRINQEQICKILDTRGWVGCDKVGDAVGAYWAVIQHAGLEVQKKYFPLFQEAALKGDIAREGLAMMEDRINLFEGKPQRYGSQIVDDDKGGKMVYQLLDAQQVDKWRSEMGMEPLEDYLKRMDAHR
ncbi:MAG: hypothetical protein IJT46_02540 [Bacteroidaceae bacterium]|nr:hypothetical protein [Bacteroidaceae bacterium]